MIVSYKITNMPVERVDVSAIPCLECVNKIAIPGLFFRYSGTGITQQGKHDHDKDQYPARDQVGVTLDRPVFKRNRCWRRCYIPTGIAQVSRTAARHRINRTCLVDILGIVEFILTEKWVIQRVKDHWITHF
jgi:hypothetical protein